MSLKILYITNAIKRHSQKGFSYFNSHFNLWWWVKTWNLWCKLVKCANALFTSRTRMPSCIYRGSMARRSSMVSYWPWQAFSFSRVPNMHFSSTKPTRKIIFTPSRGRGPMPMFECLTLAPHRQWEWETVTITEEHVPDSQNWSPGQGPGKGTHKPLGHVEDWVDLVFLQMAVGYGGDATQQSKQDLSIELYSFLKSDTGKKRAIVCFCRSWNLICSLIS